MAEKALVIGLTGLAASGKGTAAEHLKEMHGFAMFTLSDVLREEAEKRGLLESKSLEESKLILSKFGEEWRKEAGRRDILGYTLAKRIRKEKIAKAVVDGFRSTEEVELFKKLFRFVLIRMDTSLDARWKRRHEQDPNAKKEGLEKRDKYDMEKLSLGKVVEMADMAVDNNGTKEELYGQLDAIVASID
jgi:dephospho-CoA kinase